MDYKNEYTTKVSGQRLDYFGPNNVSTHVYNWAFWCFFIVTLIVFIIIGALLDNLTKRKDKHENKKLHDNLEKIPKPLVFIIALLAFILISWAAYRGYVSGGQWSGILIGLYIITIILLIIWAALLACKNIDAALFVNFLLLISTAVWACLLWNVDCVSGWFIAIIFVILLFVFACTLRLRDDKKKRPHFHEDDKHDKSSSDSHHSNESHDKSCDDSSKSYKNDGKFSGGVDSKDSRTGSNYYSSVSQRSKRSKKSGGTTDDSRTGSVY